MLANKGTAKVTLGNLKKIFQVLRTEEFWESVVELNELVKSQIDEEARKESNNKNTTLGINEEDSVDIIEEDIEGDDDDENDDAETAGKNSKSTNDEL